jgi:hypothetical protein
MTARGHDPTPAVRFDRMVLVFNPGSERLDDLVGP